MLVLNGDHPLITPETMRALAEAHASSGAAATLATAVLVDPSGYGRIVRGATGEVLRIVEHKDATVEEREIREINSSIYCFRYPLVQEALREVGVENRQAEFYLTDTIAILRGWGKRVGAWAAPDPREVSGINTPGQLEEMARYRRERRHAARESRA